MEEKKSLVINTAECKNLSDLLNSGQVFGLAFGGEEKYELREGVHYEPSNCFRPCHNQPGPCICYGGRKE